MAHIESPLREMALFAGAGGGILGGKLLGWECVCAVEWEPYPAAVLAARQNEGFLPPFPIWDDVRTFDGRPWRGLVDVVSGGFPCQDISAAGKGAGITGERSGMWKEMARIIGEVRPRYVLVENSPVLTSRGLDRVLGDLALLGYDAEWIVLGADDAGAPHRRKRIWILGHDAKRQLADPDLRGCLYGQSQKQSAKGGIDAQCFVGAGGEDVSDTNDHGLQGGVFQRGIDQLIRNRSNRTAPQHRTSGRPELHTEGWWTVEPAVGRVANGVAARVDRLKAIGNGQVPACVVLAWNTLQERLQMLGTKTQND